MWLDRQNTSGHQRRNRGSGFTLIEVLVALVVLATGLIVMANFQANLTTSSIDAKARSEAMQLAQQRMEWLRAQDLAELHNGTPPGEPVPLEGRVADYRLSWELKGDPEELKDDPDAPVLRAASVRVDWDDHRGENQSVELVSYVAAAAYAGSVNPGSGVEFSGGSVAGPGGGARIKQYDPNHLPDGRQTEFGNIDRLEPNEEGNIEFINRDTGEAIEILSPHRAAYIAGTVYVRTRGQGSARLTGDALTEDVFVRATPISLCGYDDPDETGDFGHYSYRCYLAASDQTADRVTFGWYGNVGILHPAASNQDGVCVGSLEPATALPASVRQYRGYETRAKVCEEGVQDCGTVDDDEGRPLLFPVGIEGIKGDIRVIEDHNFLVARIGNNPSAADCATYMDGAPRVDSDSDPFTDNPPEFFCFSEDPALCPIREFGVPGPASCSAVGAVCDAEGQDYHGMVYAGATQGFHYFTTREDEPNRSWGSSATACGGKGLLLGGAAEVHAFLHLNLEAFGSRPEGVAEEAWARPLGTGRYWTREEADAGTGRFVDIVSGFAGTAAKSAENLSRCLLTAPR